MTRRRDRSITHGTPVHPQPLVSVAISSLSRFDVLKATQALEGKGGSITTGTPIHDSKGARAQQLYEAVSQRVSVEIIPRTTYAPSPYQAAAAARAPPLPTTCALRPSTRCTTRASWTT